MSDEVTTRESQIAMSRLEAQVAAIETAVTAIKRRETNLHDWPKLDVHQFKALLAANNDLGAALENAGARILAETPEELSG